MGCSNEDCIEPISSKPCSRQPVRRSRMDCSESCRCKSRSTARALRYGRELGFSRPPARQSSQASARHAVAQLLCRRTQGPGGLGTLPESPSRKRAAVGHCGTHRTNGKVLPCSGAIRCSRRVSINNQNSNELNTQKPYTL